MSKFRTFRILGIVIALVAYLLSIASLSPAGAETPSVPVNVTASSTVGLNDGQAITVTVTAGSSPIYGVQARQCSSTAGSIDYVADFSPTVSGKCAATALGSAGADVFQSVTTVSPYSTATLNFKVGKGTSTFGLQSGGSATVQCDETHPCKLTLLLQVNGGTVFQSFPIGWAGQGARFNPLTPVRLLDTRTTNTPSGQPGRVQQFDVINLQVTGRGGVPVDATAAVLNVTAVQPTGAGFVTVWPRGVAQPNSSNVNFTPGAIVPNSVTVGIGSNGQVSLYHQGGTNDLIVDVMGYYSPVSGEYFTSVTPVRALDTRTTNTPSGQPGRVGAGGQVSLPIRNAYSIPNNATSVVLNVTAVTPTIAGHVTVYPDGVSLPTTSNLNFFPGDIVPNLVIVGIGASGKVNLFNANGTVDLIADVVGYYSPDNTAKQFYPITPVRSLDTRIGTGGFSSQLGWGASMELPVRNVFGIPNTASAIVMNVTAVYPTVASHLIAWPAGLAQPLASNLNYVAGDIVPNLVQVGIGSNGKVGLFNNAGSLDLVVDFMGYFA